MPFTSLSFRDQFVFFDATGFALVHSKTVFYLGFDRKYFENVLGFCVSRAYSNTFLAILRNLDVGLRAGYFKVLHVKGIGFKVFRSLIKRALYFFLGYNHVTKYSVPSSVSFRPLKGHILLFSTQKQPFGSALYSIRHLRFPDPYRGKGIRYRFQLMRFKPGKQR